MSKQETPAERMARMKQEREAVKQQGGTEELVSQLTHESTGEPNFSDIAKKLEERKANEPVVEPEEEVKMTIYVKADLASAFYALITKRGQQKEFVNQALRDFVIKKTKELNID